ncbi:class I tRNA ligase family protein, partial [Staphylococcus epidermidis]|uniref:class I tRNA ligase family protein n=1 Tax=Staphylococcus epidermidis TaxID=1282 RepID=UPI0011A53E4A
IYKPKKPVYCSPSTQSSLAQPHIEYHDKPSPSIYLPFDLKDSKRKVDSDPQFIISTTTPCTIPSNLPITVHPQL